MKPEMIRPPNVINNGRIYANKRKYSGGKNRGFNGSKREKEIVDFSIDPLWRREFTTEFQ
jgi:hypothetical protein